MRLTANGDSMLTWVHLIHSHLSLPAPWDLDGLENRMPMLNALGVGGTVGTGRWMDGIPGQDQPGKRPWVMWVAADAMFCRVWLNVCQNNSSNLSACVHHSVERRVQHVRACVCVCLMVWQTGFVHKYSLTNIFCESLKNVLNWVSYDAASD